MLVNMSEKYQTYQGIIEFIIKDKFGNILDTIREPNIVKIMAKSILAKRMPFSQVWSPSAGSGSGTWVDSGIDPNEDFAVKYILFGASFDTQGIPLGFNDPRFYTYDTITSTYVPVTLESGAYYDGGLINSIPIYEPTRPLKKIESIEYEASYQPAGAPYLQEDVRAINNVILLETTIETDEYNGMGSTSSDYFTITEVVLAAGKTIDITSTCNLTPKQLFLDGSVDDDAIKITASGTQVVSIDPTESTTDVNIIKVGDQVRISAQGDIVTNLHDLDQISPFYLVTSKAAGGRDITLDRTPTDFDAVPLTGALGIWRDTLKIFSHRILTNPITCNSDLEITARWSIIMA